MRSDEWRSKKTLELMRIFWDLKRQFFIKLKTRKYGKENFF